MKNDTAQGILNFVLLAGGGYLAGGWRGLGISLCFGLVAIDVIRDILKSQATIARIK